MSGSGATCFGLFATAAETRAAANSLNAAHPDWWITPSRLIS
jgi:4-diphosphocytidyl-2-C-methyl-D-erythritol kinase